MFHKKTSKINSVIIVVFLIMLLLPIESLFAASPFSVKSSKQTNITLNGQTLISGDYINYGGKEVFDLKGSLDIQKQKGWTIYNVISKSPELPFRKEIGVTQDRVELTVQFELPAYHNKESLPKVFYKFKVPLETLNNMNWRAITGRTHKPEQKSGKITTSTPDGKLALCRWIAFTDDKDKNIVFDLDPKGMPSFHDYGPGDIISRWTVEKSGDFVEFSFGQRAETHGGVFTGKVIIFKGKFDDYMNRHAQSKFRYYSELPAQIQYSFGSPDPIKPFAKVDKQPFSGNTDFGWINNKNLTIARSDSNSVSLNNVHSPNDNKFICNIKRPGLYIVTLRSAAIDKNHGPFSVQSNDKPIVTDENISKGTIKNITFSQWLNTGPLELSFKGDWAISNASLQLLLHKEEDFSVKRGVWLIADFYEPTPINTSTSYLTEPDYQVYVTEIKIPAGNLEPEKMPELPPSEVLKPSSTNPDMVWRYGNYIAGFGPSNFGTFLEFDTEELIRKRLTELKNGNVNVVITNGLLGRHNFKNQLPRVQRTMKKIVQIAHEMDMTIIDHHDLTLVWNKDTATRTLVEELNKLQYTVKEYLPNRGFCISNPDMVNDNLDWLTQFILDTDIDGLMMDEVAYHGKNFCGCVYCRKQFKKDTGLTLPIDETSPLINNSDSILWKTWLQWRKKQVGDWGIKLRKRVMAVKPDFSFLKYTTGYGISNRNAPLSYGADIVENARAADFIGTEIMSRNVMASHRAVFSLRKIFNLFRLDYESPVFGLVYNIHNKDFAYFGWAMNEMHGQSTWDFGYDYAPHNAIQFEKRMDSMNSEPVAEIALVYSSSSRDWPKYAGSIAELQGISQILTDNHIQHVVISEKALTKERLNDYRLVVLPAVCCLSDIQIDQIKQYIFDGGNVLMTVHTGLLNQVGILRKSWPFKDILGAHIYPNFAKYSSGNDYRLVADGVSASYDMALLKVTIDQPQKVTSFINAIDGKGQELGPVALHADYGKGKIFYCSALLGKKNYEPESSPGREWKFQMNEPIAEMLIYGVNKALGSEPLKFSGVNIPSSVLTTVYREIKPSQFSTIVHLLNATGSYSLKPGMVVPSESPSPAFPALEQDIVFDITMENIKEGYCVSPDYGGKKNIRVEKIDDFRFRITVPKENLQTYSMIYLLEN